MLKTLKFKKIVLFFLVVILLLLYTYIKLIFCLTDVTIDQ